MRQKLNLRMRLATVIIALAVITGVQLAWPQEESAGITGTVVDQSGAPVKGATVTVKDTERGTLSTTTTNDAGAFNFPRVPVGNYEIKVSATGFQTIVQSPLTLVLNQVARLGFQLKVGQVSETVEVSSGTPLLQTDTTLLGNIVDSKTAVDLPLPTRNTNQLTLIAAPGVVTPNPFGFQAAQNSFGTGRPYVNGAREQENNFILDGMDNNQPDNNDVAYVPAPDAIQEFNLITGNAPADFGNYLGGVVNVSIKSGTNHFHGDVYEYARRSGWAANSFTNNLNHIPRPGLHYDNFGATLGGPILKDKLFFFTDFAGSRWSQPSTTTTLTTLSLAQRGGDFSAMCTAGFAGGICNNLRQQLYDPASSANPALRAPFLNNQIPVGRFNSAAKAIIGSQFYPAQIANDINQFTTNSYQGDVKIDWIASDKDRVMGRWSQQGVTATNSQSIQLLGDGSKSFPLKSFVLDETHMFSSRLLNDARVGFTYFPVTEGWSNPTGQNLGKLFGIGGVTDTFLPQLVFNSVAVNPPAGIPDKIGNNDLVQSFHDTTLQFEDSISWTHGRHSVHAGFEVYHYIMNDLYPGNAGLAGQFFFNGQFTGRPGVSTGHPAADFLLGLPQDVAQGNGGGGNKYLRNSLISFFGQDNWRATDTLTLNLGLRYELTTARATNNGQDVNFDRVTGVPHIGFAYNTYSGITNLQPRLGFAWNPSWSKNTVFRGAYGISGFMEANGVNNLPYQNPPFIQAHEVNFSGQALPNSTLDQGFNNFPAAACTASSLQALSPACLAGITIHATNPNLRPAVDQQWNFSIQHQFGSKTSVQVGYVGNKIDHMSDIFILNQKVLNPNGTVSPGPFFQPLINCCGAGNSPTVRYNDSGGIERYNALQISATGRQWQGLQYQLNYTWSKCLSNGLGYFGQYGDEEASFVPGGSVSQTNSSFFFQNAYNPKGDYGRCINDVASLFNGYLLYALPFGHGRQFASNASPVVNALIGGWSIGTDFVLHSGFAINPSTADQSGTTSSGATRPNCVLGVSKQGSGAIVVTNIDTVTGATTYGKQWLNPASVSAPLSGFGNCGAGSFRGPGLTSADLTIGKQFILTERTNLEFQAQFLNVTNTPIFGAPNAFFDSANPKSFGVISSSYPGREIQLGFKFNF